MGLVQDHREAHLRGLAPPEHLAVHLAQHERPRGALHLLHQPVDVQDDALAEQVAEPTTGLGLGEQAEVAQRAQRPGLWC